MTDVTDDKHYTQSTWSSLDPGCSSGSAQLLSVCRIVFFFGCFALRMFKFTATRFYFSNVLYSSEQQPKKEALSETTSLPFAFPPTRSHPLFHIRIAEVNFHRTFVYMRRGCYVCLLSEVVQNHLPCSQVVTANFKNVLEGAPGSLRHSSPSSECITMDLLQWTSQCFKSFKYFIQDQLVSVLYTDCSGARDEQKEHWWRLYSC